MYESFGLIGMQLPEKYKENFDVSSEGASTWKFNVNQFDFSRAMPTLNLRTGMLGERDWARSGKTLGTRLVQTLPPPLKLGYVPFTFVMNRIVRFHAIIGRFYLYTYSIL